MGRRPEPLESAMVEARLVLSRVPGAAIAGIQAGELAWAAGYGNRWAGRTSAIDRHTVFSAASVSKAVTALAIFGLVEAGLLQLHQDVRPLLAFPLESHPILQHQTTDAGPITPLQLLQHRAGVIGRGTTPRRDATGFLGAGVGGGSCRFLQPLTDPSELRPSATWFGVGGRHPVQRTCAPDVGYSYSGAGYFVLQHLLEQVTGERFEDHLAGVMAAYGAANATFALRPDVEANFAAGHSSDGAPLPGAHELVPWSSAGGLYSDVLSLSAILSGVLRADSGVPGISHRDEFTAGAGTRAITRETGEVGFTHGGDNSGYRAVWTGFPGSGDGVVVLTNGRGTDGASLRNDLAGMALRTVSMS